jgi:hypothetical protein
MSGTIEATRRGSFEESVAALPDQVNGDPVLQEIVAHG